MGQEILYCSRCQSRLMGSDLERGKAIRVGNTVACKDCAPEVLLALPPDQRPPTTPKPRKTSTGRIPIIRPPSTSASRSAAPRRDEPAPPPKSNANLVIGLTVGGVALVLLLAMMAGGGSSPTRSRDPEPRTPRYIPPSPPDDPRPSSSTLDRLKQRVKDHPEDIDGNAAEALQAFRQLENGPQMIEARELRDAVLALQRNAYNKEFAAVEKDVTPPLDRGDFARAATVLEEARKRHATEEWASRINGKLAELRTREAATRPSPVPAPADRPWKPLFDHSTLESFSEGTSRKWKVVGGALENFMEDGDAAQTRQELADGEIRIRFEVEGLTSAYFTARQGPDGGFAAAWETAGLQALEGKPHELLFVMKGDAVRATLDGQLVLLSGQGKPATGHLQFNSRGKMLRILAIEVR